MKIAFDASRLRAAIPAFANETLYTSAMLQMKWIAATCIVSDDDDTYILSERQRECVLDLLVAHLLEIDSMIAMGQNVVNIQGASVDKVSVTATPPVATSGFQLWLQATPHGQLIRVILQSATRGGFYIGGSATEKRSFRRAGGFFR